MRRPGIKPGSRPWQGRILSLYYRRTQVLSVPRLELGTSRVLGERHDQLDHTDLNGLNGVSGFRSQYLDLAKVARFRLRQYPAQVVEYLGFDPSTSSLRRTHASDCANTPGASAGARQTYLVLRKKYIFCKKEAPSRGIEPRASA